MLLTIERVVILKSVNIFEGTPDFALASVAGIVEEVEVIAGETLIHEGAIEDSMYIVLEGEVQVHRQGKPIIDLGPGRSVGELAVLDPEPRSASVSAVTDSYLFRIDKEPFDEVMADHPEIAQGVIKALCQRIRDQGQVMSQNGNAEVGPINQTETSE